MSEGLYGTSIGTALSRGSCSRSAEKSYRHGFAHRGSQIYRLMLRFRVDDGPALDAMGRE